MARCTAFRRVAVAATILTGTVRVGYAANCVEHNYCNGHGTCVTLESTCDCFDGWGSPADISLYKRPDCGNRVCPSGRAWADVATTTTTAHALAECSNKGQCERSSGVCVCKEGFEGDACQRRSCPNECSGHGRCLSMKQMAMMSDALPLSTVTTYSGAETTTTWDEDQIYGCVCDSSWTVGLGSGETQTPEWFGHDCSLRHCASADDPLTSSVDETDCNSTLAAGGKGTGESGNLCHVDCANRGLCDFKTGLCNCFTGSYGSDCSSTSVLAK